MVKIDPGAVSEESVANSMAEIVNKTEDEVRRRASRCLRRLRCASGSTFQADDVCGSFIFGCAALQAIEQKVKEALDCPCVADLKNSSCGEPFVAGASATQGRWRRR